MGNSSNLSNDITVAHKSLTTAINSILSNTITLSTASNELASIVQRIEERFMELAKKEKELEEREVKVANRSKELDEKELELKGKEQDKAEEKIQNQTQSFNVESRVQVDNFFEKQINIDEKDVSLNLYSSLKLNVAPGLLYPNNSPSCPPLPILPSPILQWLPKRNFNLIYKATRDGFHKDEFHRMCNNKGATVSIIEAKGGYLFGGYAPIEWGLSKEQISTAKRDSIHPNFFLFTLTNPHNITPTQYFLKDPNDERAHHSSGFHICFGNAPDLEVAWKDAHIKDISYSAFGMYHCSYKDTTGMGTKTFTGSTVFVVKEIEVYQVI